MEGQGGQEFSVGFASRENALSALRRIAKEPKGDSLPENPISFANRIAMEPSILAFLHSRSQGVALERNGELEVLKVYKDPGTGRLEIRKSYGLDPEWIEKHGTHNDRIRLKELQTLTPRDVIRTFRDAIAVGYDPIKYKSSLRERVSREIGEIAQVPGDIIGAAAGKLGKIHQKRKPKETSYNPYMEKEKQKKRRRRVVLAAGALAIGAIVAGGVGYEKQHPGTVGRFVQGVSQTWHHDEQEADQTAPQGGKSQTAERPRIDEGNKPTSDSDLKPRGLTERLNNPTPAEFGKGLGAILAASAAVAGAEVGRRKFLESRERKRRKQAETSRKTGKDRRYVR